jgi:modulator of FtsH protease
LDATAALISIDAWSSYLSVQAEEAATLTGLVFVAVSINLSSILSIPGLTGRAAESLLQLFGVVVISTTALIPRQSPGALGTEVLGLGAALWVTQTVLQVRYIKSKTGHSRMWVVTRIIQTQFANVPFFISGILLLGGSPAGLYWLAPGLIFSLIAGVASAWVLLVEILR